MEEFRHAYVRICKDNHIEPQDCVVDKLKSAEHRGGDRKRLLDLSTNGISAKTCAILGKLLATDFHFVEVRFADCMLSEDAIKGLAQGLCHNKSVKKLDLKGNNIRSSGTEALGKMLRMNVTLLSLCLEWNALGLIDSAFAVFCDGIAANSTLQSLDLRNNQINHEGATELASCLKRNTSLRALDLRWNNAGLLGGRSFIEMLQSNKTLCRLEVAGNNVPSDIIKAIETSVSNNMDRHSVVTDYKQRQSALTKQITQMEADKALQLNDLMDTIEKQESQYRRSQRSATLKLGSLQESLEERKSAFNSLAAKLSMTESELALAEQKANDYMAMITRLKTEMQEMVVTHNNDIRRDKEERATEEMKLMKELSEAHDKNMQLRNKVEDLERKCNQQQEALYEHKEQLTHLQAELKMKGSQFDERVSMEKQRHKETMREMEQSKQKDIVRLKQEAEDAERALRERIQKLESQRLELEEEVSHLKAANMSEKLSAEERLSSVKHKIKLEEEQRHKQLEERIRVLQTSKDELQSHCNQQASLVSELQCKNSNLTLELDTLRRRLEEMGQELAEKNNYTLAEVNKVRLELDATVSKLEAERASKSDLREKLAQADSKLSEQMMRHRQVLEDKDREIVSLQERLKAKELEMTRIREEENQRVHMLQSAIMSYVGSKTQAM